MERGDLNFFVDDGLIDVYGGEGEEENGEDDGGGEAWVVVPEGVARPGRNVAVLVGSDRLRACWDGDGYRVRSEGEVSIRLAGDGDMFGGSELDTCCGGARSAASCLSGEESCRCGGSRSRKGDGD